MNTGKVVVGFIGSGGIARSHAFCMSSLRYYYNDPPEIEFEAVCSLTEKSRETFGRQFGFRNSLSLEEFIADDRIDTVYILGPNKVHYEHLVAAGSMPSVKRIYIEKPICSTTDEEKEIARFVCDHPGLTIQAGFQFLFIPAIREALVFWKSGILGNPIHFDLKYYHGDYLIRNYREKRATRLTPSPEGGAMADLGSHALSMLIAFIGDNLSITSAIQAGSFEDVNPASDLYSLITIYDNTTSAAGSLSASRISSGTGDMLSLEIFAENGALRFSSGSPEYYEYYLENTGTWNRIVTGSKYKDITSFPSGHVPPGWLRSMIHAHYVFLNGTGAEVFVPDIEHGLAVQRLVRQAAEHLYSFRESAAGSAKLLNR